MKMKAIREWWRRVDEFVRRYDLADHDPWENLDRRLRHLEEAAGLRPPAGKGRLE